MTHFVELSARARDLKIDALLAHRSQYTSRSQAAEAADWVGAQVAREAGVDGLVEGFQGYF